jgi:DNA polymerase (family 10)
MKNSEIAGIFNAMADLLDIKGENPFRIRAYRKASFTVGSLGKDVSGMSEGDLLEIPGIGKDLAGKIHEYLVTGRIAAYEKIKQELPEGLITLLGVPGLGPKTVGLLFKEYHISDIDQLEMFARQHKLSALPGIKEKTEASIIKGIEMLRRYSGSYPIGKVLPVAFEIKEYLRTKASVRRVEIAGSIRRWKDTVRDIDIICTSDKPKEVMRVFTAMPDVRQVLMKGPARSSVVISDGMQVDIRVVENESFGSAMSYFTGSKGHNIRLRELAVKAGLKLNEYGIFREQDNNKLGGRNEEDIYNVLGLQYVPPELREDTGEIEAALDNALPELVELKDIRGDLHCHSNWSDGGLDIEELIKGPIEKGYAYMALTDHSKGLGIARGLSDERLLGQIQLVEALNKRLKGFRILTGTEVNIRNDGSLDFDDEMLRRLDFVIASVHSGFRQSKEQLTERIVKAMENPYVSVIGHISGRLIGEREAYELDMERVLDQAAKTATALEINAYPLRLDLSEPYVKRAGEKKVPVVISTDSHTLGQFDNMQYGVSVARRGWLEKKDVLNTLPCSLLIKRVKKKK